MTEGGAIYNSNMVEGSASSGGTASFLQNLTSNSAGAIANYRSCSCGVHADRQQWNRRRRCDSKRRVGDAGGMLAFSNRANSGAGIYNLAAATLDRSTIETNTAASGGGGILNEGVLRLWDSYVNGNKNATAGGGILNVHNARLLIERSAFPRTTRPTCSAAGIWNGDSAELELISSTISANQSR